MIQEGKVTYVNWRNYRPAPHTIETYHMAQDSMILSCLGRNKDISTYIWMGDTDEFIYPVAQDNFIYALKENELNSAVSGVRIRGFQWRDDPDNPLPLIDDPEHKVFF